MEDLASAIKKLRTALGDSQQKFATRLKLSTRAIANYESGRHPIPPIIWSLSRLASDHGHSEIADVFVKAFTDKMKASMQPVTDYEKACVMAVLALVRNRNHIERWSEIKRAALIELERLAATARSIILATDRDDLQDTLVRVRHWLAPTAQEEIMRIAKKRYVDAGKPYTDDPWSFRRFELEVMADYPELYQQFLTENPTLAFPPLPAPAAKAEAKDARATRRAAKGKKS
jgi:transcriptional regulator with XRE-family HTH domain